MGGSMRPSGRRGPGKAAASSTCGSEGSRKTEKQQAWLEHLEPQRPSAVTHLFQGERPHHLITPLPGVPLQAFKYMSL